MFCSTIAHKNFLPVIHLSGRKQTDLKYGVIAFSHLGGDVKKGYYVYRLLTGKYFNSIIVRAGRLAGISTDSFIKRPHSFGNVNEEACNVLLFTSANIETTNFSR